MHSDILFKPAGGEEEVIDQIYFGCMDDKEDSKAQKVLLAYIGDENGIARQVFQTSEFSDAPDGEFEFDTEGNIVKRIKSPPISIFPKRYNGKAYGIKEHLKETNTSVKEVILPETITAIAKGAFVDYNGLKNITLPFIGTTSSSQLVDIFGNSKDWDEDKNMYSPRTSGRVSPFLDTVTILNTGNLRDQFWNTSIDNLILKNVTEISTRKQNYEYYTLFPNNIDNIEIHGTVAEIPRGIFKNISAKVAIYAPVTHIQPEAFYGFGGEVILPDTLKTIGNVDDKPDFAWSPPPGVFELSTMEKINIPEGTEGIGYHGFYDCKSLKEITIPSTLTKIGESAFFKTSKLERINISNLASWCNVGIGGFTSSPFYAGTVEKKIYLNGEQITTLKLDDKVIMDGIIKPYIFYGYKPEKLVIGANIKEVGKQAFIDPDDQFSASNYIFYKGNQEDWQKIEGREYIVRESKEIDYLYFYSEEKPTDNTHKYWHYDDNNEPAIWEKEESAT